MLLISQNKWKNIPNMDHKIYDFICEIQMGLDKYMKSIYVCYKTNTYTVMKNLGIVFNMINTLIPAIFGKNTITVK